jgi:hypothetical protein
MFGFVNFLNCLESIGPVYVFIPFGRELAKLLATVAFFESLA